jgi:2,3-bisphosphoglycerate-dependent phosphoglycerate mutase
MNQAKSLGEALKNEPITHVFSSDLKRAIRTASAIADHHPQVSVVPDKLFREQDFGDLEGKPWRQTWASDIERTHAKSKNGESTAAVNQRATTAWNWVLQTIDVYDAPNDLYVVVVSHGLFLSAIFKAVCGFYYTPTPTKLLWSNAAYLKFTVLPDSDPSFKVENINETSHLTAVQRQRGGVGSSQYDETQKTMKDFFASNPKKKNPNAGKVLLPCSLFDSF